MGTESTKYQQEYETRNKEAEKDYYLSDVVGIWR
jgi:hypothetical protein